METTGKSNYAYNYEPLENSLNEDIRLDCVKLVVENEIGESINAEYVINIAEQLFKYIKEGKK